MHSKNISHRDLKPENIVLFFYVKILNNLEYNQDLRFWMV